MKCIKGYEIRVLKSAAGFYIGTTEEEGFPMCRISSYYPTKDAAQTALDNKTFYRFAEEISFCNGGCGCYHDGDFNGDEELEFDPSWIEERFLPNPWIQEE